MSFRAMSHLFFLLISLLPFCTPLPAASADAAIRDALNAQVVAWNRGDIPAFVRTYAEDCTFVGKQILQGREQLLARYKRIYPSSETMGKLTFSNLNVRPLGWQAATVTGEWRLDRTSAGGGPAGGLFSLVWQAKNGIWQIILDHTS